LIIFFHKIKDIINLEESFATCARKYFINNDNRQIIKVSSDLFENQSCRFTIRARKNESQEDIKKTP